MTMMETTIHSKPKFVIIGGAGKIAKYHFEAIEKVGGEVVAVIDPNLSYEQYKEMQIEVGFDSIEEYLDNLDEDPKYFVILSPNHLHVEHSTWALKYGDVICEKPLAISTSELAHLKSEESLGHTKVHPIMQLRTWPYLIGLHTHFQNNPPKWIEIEYVLPRGKDYVFSWQGDKRKSGGLVFNIAIHMLDFLLWTFGEYKSLTLSTNCAPILEGELQFAQTEVHFYFSTVNASHARRRMNHDGHVVNLQSTLPLHTYAYNDIVNGRPLSISDIEPTIKLCEEIRNYK